MDNKKPGVYKTTGHTEPFRSKRFYTNLKEERINAGLSQEKLAAELSVTKETIRKIETMKSIPNVILAMDISAYFGKTVDEMFYR